MSNPKAKKVDCECRIVCADSRTELRNWKNQIDLIVTSPPYADARHKHYDSIGPDQFKDWFLTFHTPFYEALKPTGSLVINIKDKVVDGVRHRYVWQTIEALAAHGWFCIDDYVWRKTNPMPGYWPTRLRDGWEYCFHLAKSTRPFMDQDGVLIPAGNWTESRLAKLGQNDLTRHNSANKSGFGRDLSKWVGKETVLPSNVISAALVGKDKGHPAVFPVDIPEFFIKLLCPPNGMVCDPFGGSGTTGIAANNLSRRCLLIENNREYCTTAIARLKKSGVTAIEHPPSDPTNHTEVPQDTAEQICFFDKPVVFKSDESINGHGPKRKAKAVKYTIKRQRP